MIPHYKLYINSEFKDSDERQNIVNPANGEIIATAATADKDDIDLALSAARAAFDNGTWRKLSLNERKGFRLKISQGILNKAADLAKLET